MNDLSIMVLPPDRWREAKALRLEALLNEPSAFFSSYDDEAAYGDAVWQSHSQTAFERDGHLRYFAELNGDLVGMAGAT